MYNMQQIAQSVKKEAKRKNIPLNVLLPSCNLNINTISDFAKGQEMSVMSFARIASELDCSIDYLLGRTDNPAAHKLTAPAVALGDISNNSGVIGGIGNNAPVTINSNSTEAQAKALLNAFNNLDPMKQAKLLVYTDELIKNKD